MICNLIGIDVVHTLLAAHVESLVAAGFVEGIGAVTFGASEVVPCAVSWKNEHR